MEPVAKPLNDEERQRIAALLETGMSCTAIAKELGRSNDTISRVAKSVGHRFGQSSAARARDARSAYTAERRAVHAAQAQARIGLLLAGFDDPQPVVAWTPTGPQAVMAQPDARAQRDRASAIQTLQRTVLDIDRHDNRGDSSEAAALIERLVSGLFALPEGSES